MYFWVSKNRIQGQFEVFLTQTSRKPVQFNLVKSYVEIYPKQQPSQHHMLLFSSNFYLVFYQKIASQYTNDKTHDAMWFYKQRFFT